MSESSGVIHTSTEEQLSFVLDDKEITPIFLGRYSIQVRIGENWLLYKDSALMDNLKPGRYRWWGFFAKWRALVIDTRTKLMDHHAVGRVKGPAVPREPGNAPAPGSDLACEVKASLSLSIKIKNTETFLQFSEPISVFNAALHDLVIEYIGKLDYDQYGNWATNLRTSICNALQGERYNAEKRLGLNIVDVFVVGFEPSSTHDRQVLAMYRLLERGKREMVEAMDNRKRDKESAQSIADQGSILNIAPSILKLQDSPIGKALLEQDARLKELIIASGINPGINIQPLQEQPYQVAGPQPHYTYLQPVTPNPAQLAPGQQGFPSQSGPLNSQFYQQITGSLSPTVPIGQSNPNFPPVAQQPQSGPLFPPPQPSGPFPPQYPSGPLIPPQQPSGPFPPQYPSGPQNPSGFLFQNPVQAPLSSQADLSDRLPVDEMRQTLELDALLKADFNAAGRGQINAANEWTLMVYRRRQNGILTIAFTCPPGYPNIAPKVQIKTSTGSGYTASNPNTIHGWQAHRMLVDVAQELMDTTL